MAHGHHDGFLSWDWDSDLLLSNPSPIAAHALEANGSVSALGSAPDPSLDFSLHQHNRSGKSGSSKGHVHAEFGQSESRNQISRADHWRDPRLDCPNFLAGKVPCACTENDEDDTGISRKRSKPVPRCQVAACGTELTDLKGYHQRHRVCLNCAQKTRVILREQPHRYCQQCGKFHPICDFDEGKRSCRRKLEKHNNRRRRRAGEDGLTGLEDADVDTHNDRSLGDGLSALDVLRDGELKKSSRENSSVDIDESLDVTGERLPSNVQAPTSYNLPDDQCLNSAVQGQALNPATGTCLEENAWTSEPASRYTDLPPSSQVELHKQEPSFVNRKAPLTMKSQQDSRNRRPALDFLSQSSPQLDGIELQARGSNDEESLLALLMENTGKSTHLPHDDGEYLVSSPVELQVSSTVANELDKEVAYSSPLPTGRISFKLYDWNPGDFPRHLRQQIMEWLSNMPVDLEGYIRSGCTILTIFIAMPEAGWSRLHADWAGSVLSLIEAERSRSKFWSSGSITARLDDHVVHIEDGEVMCTESRKQGDTPVLDRLLPLCLVSGSDEVVVIHGRNLACSQSRVLISFDGKYIINDAFSACSPKETKGIGRHICRTGNCTVSRLFVSISALPPKKCGTAYVEVENASGTSNYIPLLIAEKEIVNEVRTLELETEGPTSCCTRNAGRKDTSVRLGQERIRTLLFDLGWVLKHVSGCTIASELHQDVFEGPLRRLRRLLCFAIERSWFNIVERVLRLAKIVGCLGKVGVLDNGLNALQYAAVRRKMIMVKHLLGCPEVLCLSNRHPVHRPNLGIAGQKALQDFWLRAQSWRKSLLNKNTEVMWTWMQNNCTLSPHGRSLAARSGMVTSNSISIADMLLIAEREAGISNQEGSGVLPDCSGDSHSSLFMMPLEKFCGFGAMYRDGREMRPRHYLRSRRGGLSKIILTPKTGPGWTSLRGGHMLHEELSLYIPGCRSRYSDLLSCSVVTGVVCAGFCVLMLQYPKQTLLSLSVQQGLWSTEFGLRKNVL